MDILKHVIHQKRAAVQEKALGALPIRRLFNHPLC